MKAHPQLLAIEALEVRIQMSTCRVTRLSDIGAGMGFRGDLRYCINKVNAEPGPDIILIHRTGTINLTAALPTLATDIDIQGPGSDLLAVRRSTGGNYRIFHVTGGANIEISRLTVANGLILDGPSSYGGGIYNAGNLTLRNATITGNTVRSTVHFANGGGIYNQNGGNLTIIDSVISNNHSVGSETGAGGGICNSGTASIYNSAIVGNIAENDTGVGFTGVGAGISNVCAQPTIWGSLLLFNSTVHSNQALPAGQGGIGGILSYGFSVISHSTIASNGGNGFTCNQPGECYIRNTIVADNTEGDVDGTLTSSGYNLIGDSSDGGGFAPTDILDVDPLLGPLQDNGGPTQTAALLPGSPAIDAGDNSDSPEFDQRGPGFPRIVNGTIDIGAFEVQATGAPRQPDSLAFLITADSDSDEEDSIP